MSKRKLEITELLVCLMVAAALTILFLTGLFPRPCANPGAW